MTLSPQWLDELRARTTLSALIGQTVKIQRAGREYKACCPFHHEKTPSFTINDEKGFYHCFGCSAHGDAIRWMTDQRGLGFMDAVKELAASAGMDVPAPDPQSAQRAERAKTLRDVTEAAARWYQAQLGGQSGAEARQYLEKRGIDSKLAQAFGLGLAPDSRGGVKSALSEFPEAMLVEAGMLIDVEGKDTYDRFRGRLMIPIRDPRGRVIAFGGRILGPGEPKYLNSPDTPLFDKGRTLYNLDRASPASRKTNRIVVVEGYMDVIGLAGAGFDDAVAPLGTALTEQQIEMLWRMVPVPVLCFDGDAAGQKAAMRAASRALALLRPGYSLAFATLPKGKDPDDLVRENGPRAFDRVLAGAQPLVDKLWGHELDAAPLRTPEERADLKSRLARYVEAIRNADVAAHYRAVFAERYDAMFFSSDARSSDPRGRRGGGRPVRSAFWQKNPRLRPPHDQTRAIGGSGMEDAMLRAMIGGLLRHPAKIVEHAEELSHLQVRDGRWADLLAAMLSATWGEQNLDTRGLLAILESGDVYNAAHDLLRADGMHFSFTRSLAENEGDGAVRDRALRDLDEVISTTVTWPEVETALHLATERAAESLDEESYAAQQQLRVMKNELTRRLADLAQGDGEALEEREQIRET